MKTESTILISACLAIFLAGTPLSAQETPALTIYQGGNTYWAPDNSTVFTAAPNVQFVMEVTGHPGAPFGLYMSLFTTPFPTNIVPPPLFLMPPLLPVLVGPAMVLDEDGAVSFNGVVPSAFATLGYDVDLYFQAFVQDPVNGFELTNGIRMAIKGFKYKADLAVAKGAALTMINVFGRIQDPDAGDNKAVPGNPGLQNGAPLVPDPDINSSTYGFDDLNAPPEGTPMPTTSIYLNGLAPLVPGDTGIDKRFILYPKEGSQLYIHTRDRICRDAENMNLQHIIVPIYENGEKVRDLNVYQFHDQITKEYGFMVVDVMNNDFYELTGTRMKSNNLFISASPWDAHVAISPDGRFMAAVVKDRADDIVNNPDELYLIKLKKEDVWSTGLHARKVKINDATEKNYRATRVFAESLVFVKRAEGTSGYPYALFFFTNKYNQNASNPMNVQPPIELPSVLHTAKPLAENKTAYFFKFADLPKVGGSANYEAVFYGLPTEYQDGFNRLNQIQWLRSEDERTLACRVAGRYTEWDKDNSVWIEGAWCWDIFAFTDVQAANIFTVKNITRFDEPSEQAGFYIAPFGQAYNGWAKAAISPGGTYVAFTAKDSEGNNKDDLYFAPTDGSKAGILKDQPITGENSFKGEFIPAQNDTGRAVVDPYFVAEDSIVFFCGKAAGLGLPYLPAEMDLFLYRDTFGDLRNLTMTAAVKEPDPPFEHFGVIRPSGLFTSRDGRYLFFLRGDAASHKLNLVGVDVEAGFQVFDLTGNEFSQGFIPDLALNKDGSYFWGPEKMNMSIVPAGTTDLLFFTAKYFQYNIYDSYQVFMLNLNFPLAAFPVTSFDPVGDKGTIDNLAADSTGTYIAFSRSNAVKPDGSDGAYEKIWVVDLAHGAYMRELTANTPYAGFNAASIDGSFRFLSSPSTQTPAELIYGMGQGGSDDQANNPQAARFWLYPLESVSNPAVEAVSYPLTEEGQLLLFGALPYDG